MNGNDGDIKTHTVTQQAPRDYMPNWNAFLNSLATSGGNLLMLFIMSVVLMAVVVYLMNKWGPGAPVVITLAGAFGTFTGALVGILRGNKVDPVPSGMVATTSTTTSTIPPPPEVKVSGQVIPDEKLKGE